MHSYFRRLSETTPDTILSRSFLVLVDRVNLRRGLREGDHILRSKSVVRTFPTNHVTSPFSVVDDALSSSRVRSEFGVSRGHVARTRSAFPSAQHGCSFRSFDAPEIYRGAEVAVGSSESARVVYLSRWRVTAPSG